VEIGFEAGLPVTLDDKKTTPVMLIRLLNALAGDHGVGRIDSVEDRLVGIKSREIYEAPAGVTLLTAHEALESLTLSKEQRQLKSRVAQEYADLVYNGLWYSAHHRDLAAYIQSTQRHVTGNIRMKLHKGTATVVGRKSPKSLYDFSLATYGKGDNFDRNAAVGFINIWGLPVRVQAQAQAPGEDDTP
jgi:argininosuccinate synthase